MSSAPRAGAITKPEVIAARDSSGEPQTPGLAHLRLAEVVVSPGLDDLEPMRRIDAPRARQDGVGPKDDLVVAGLACERDAGRDQRLADPKSTGEGFDIQQAQAAHALG